MTSGLEILNILSLLQQAVFLPNFALALLYMTVLSLG